METVSRAGLAVILIEAISHALPDRAPGLFLALATRLELGLWTLELDARARGALPDSIFRDRMLHEIRRALTAHDPDTAATRMQMLERWLVDSIYARLEESIGANAVARRSERDVWVPWAADALEGGLDSESLRVLAGLTDKDAYEFRRYADRSIAELGLPPIDATRCAERYARRIAFDYLSGREGSRATARRLFEADFPAGERARHRSWFAHQYDDADEEVPAGFREHMREILRADSSEDE